MTDQYSGICRGGPFDGQRRDFHVPRMEVGRIPDIPIQRRPPEPGQMRTFVAARIIGVYNHDGNDEWEWKDTFSSN